MKFPNLHSARLATRTASWSFQGWAFIDGYTGIDNSNLHVGSAKLLYDEYWLLGSYTADVDIASISKPGDKS